MGEYLTQMYCPSCPFILPIGEAAKPICPDCGARLWIREEGLPPREVPSEGVEPSKDSIATCAQPAPPLPDTPDRMHGKAGENSDALNRPQSPNPSPLEKQLQDEQSKARKWAEGDDYHARPVQDIVGCLDCDEPAEFITFSDPPLAKCFRCALLKAMERLCALCGKHPTECIVRAIGENERQDVIGICANCFSKRLSGMRN